MNHCFATQVTTLSSPPPQLSLHSSIDNYSHRFREALGTRNTWPPLAPRTPLKIGHHCCVCFLDFVGNGVGRYKIYFNVQRYYVANVKTRVCLLLWDVQNVGFLRAVWSYHVRTVCKMIKVAACRVAWLIILHSPCCCDV